MVIITIIGGGPGGYIAAIRSAQLGAKVNLIEKKHLGGVCLNKGCIPTKAMFETIKLISKLKKAKSSGLDVNYQIDFQKFVLKRNNIVANLRFSIESLVKLNKINLIKGEAKVLDQNTILVDSENIYTNFIIIATGSQPKQLSNFPLDHYRILNSDDIFNLDKIPYSLTIIGGGVIGLEMACLFNELGSKVEVLEILPGILNGFDQEAVNLLKNKLVSQGIIIKTGEVPVLGNIYSEKILVVPGRAALICPNELNLELEKGFIKVNQNMQTNYDNIYAVGDCIGGFMLAHAASSEAIIAVEHILKQNNNFNKSKIPQSIFTLPEIAFVGDKKQGIVGKANFSINGRAHTLGDTDGFVKITVNPEDKKIINATIIGPHANDLISIIIPFIGKELNELLGVTFPHPTLAETIYEAALDVEKRSVHSFRN